ncbi:chemotaxis protein CheA [Sphingomonas glaciei]|uniref:Chemotaxis protein CheA n=1 Tax=Sphingomonas glaciei TaxID=2938948 RepID=A0ABY5MZ21_9SPHN|nr:chemotaxis protein CheA [Sphingomonas glaciei]UUR08328.1 chemotaxis protein CheA [Sphingomonas glaciei]
MSANDPAAAFLTEAGELLDGVEQALLDLDHRLDDRDLIDTVFRGLHTLKGSGAMFGFEQLASFTHHCETAFDRVRKQLTPASRDLVAVVLAAQDHMRTLLEDSSDDTVAAGAAILEQLRGVMDRASEVTERASPPQNGWHLNFWLPVEAMANGTNPLVLLDELRALGECRVTALTDRVPPLDELAATDWHIGWSVELRGDISRGDIDDVFIFVSDDMELHLQSLSGTDKPGAIEVENEPAAGGDQRVKAANDGGPTTGKTADTVRVPAERLDLLMDRVGELVIVQSRLSQLAQGGTGAATPTLHSISEDIERLAGELRDTMMVLRMVPVASLFGRFRRLVHDLARDTGKSIELVTEGETTEVDKTVIERLADPLIHLIRNSCDHGLEGAGEREAAGKPPTGQIKLSARQAGGEVIIDIRDDGRGIDLERVRAKAEAQELVAPGQTLSDHDTLQLIFHPGFSTAQQVTSLSGRGVGMDVVKRTMESLRGTIDVASVAGRGSTISLRIPLTLAIIDGLLIRVGTARYVIPLSAVEECIELSTDEDRRSEGRSLITLRDQLVPFMRLRELFASQTSPDLHQKIVIISTGAERVGLVVDQIIGSHQTVIKPMSPVHGDVTIFAGATILGDGSVALILDVAQLLSLGQQQEERLRAVA